MARPFVFDRSWDFDVPVTELWDTLTRTDRYTDWWTWLVRCDLDGLTAGAGGRCTVQPPLPYRLRFDLDVHHVVPCERVEVRVGGDVAGEASLRLDGDGGRSRARLAWELELTNPLLKRLAAVGRPMMVWGHDRVIEIGLRQFHRRALDGTASGRVDRPPRPGA